MSQWIMLDFQCPTHGRFEKLCDKRKTDALTAPCTATTIRHTGYGADGVCATPSPRVECYAVRGKVRAGEMLRGKSDPMPPNVLDTRPLAEGVPYETWHEQESARLAKVLDGE